MRCVADGCHGYGGDFVFADRADAAQELMQSADVQNVADLAGIDGRIAIFFVFGPVLGWVAYNILGPGLRQLKTCKRPTRRERVCSRVRVFPPLRSWACRKRLKLRKTSATSLASTAASPSFSFWPGPRLGCVQHPRPGSSSVRRHAKGQREEKGCARGCGSFRRCAHGHAGSV